MDSLLWTCVTSAVVIGCCYSSSVPAMQSQLVCHSENFEAVCPDHQVVLINRAHYGRMEINRCAKQDFGFIGCKTDVTLLLDRKCSGRHLCQFRVLDEVFPGKPCHDDIKSYLNVTYECVNVESPESRRCSTGTIQVSSKHGYLSNLVAEETSCGTVTSPWMISGKPGQHISLTLYDFTLYSRRSQIDMSGRSFTSSVCHHIFATIDESGISERICDQQERRRPFYVSKEHELQVMFVAQDTGEENYVLIHYAIEGCPNIAAPVNGWVKRDGPTVSLGCHQEDVRWSLHCDNSSQWIGHQFNCSTGGGAYTDPSGGYFGHMSLSLGVVIVIVLGLAIAIGLLVLAAGLILMKRRNREHERQEAVMLYGTKTPSSEIYGKHRPWVYERTSSQCSSQCMVHGAREYEYGTVVYGHRDYAQSPDIVQSSNNDLTQDQQQDTTLYSHTRNQTLSKAARSSVGSLSGIPGSRHDAPIQAKVQTNITVGAPCETGEGAHTLINTKKEETCDMCMGNQRPQAESACIMHTFKPALPQL